MPKKSSKMNVKEVETAVWSLVPLTVDELKSRISSVSYNALREMLCLVSSRMLELTEESSNVSSSSGKSRKKEKESNESKEPKESKEKAKRDTTALLENQRWVKYVLNHATSEGWDEFVIERKKRNSTEKERVSMCGSIEVDGEHVFSDTKKKLAHNQAMTLASQWKKSRPELWAEFKKDVEVEVEEEEMEVEVEVEIDMSPPVVKAATASSSKESSSTATATTTATATVATVASVTTAAASSTSSSVPTASKVGKSKPNVSAPSELEWSCKDDGNTHPWTFEGREYLRNAKDEVWLMGKRGKLGAWVGKYDRVLQEIDVSVEEPDE